MHFSTDRIEIMQGDITRVKTDAIVNAANSSLMGGGGVDGAIHRAGGSAILDACKAIVAQQGVCSAGEAVITTGGNLPAKYVIHTVGPVWRGGDRNEAQKLADCYRNSLTLAVENDCHTVAFPNISTGVYRFPKELAAQIAVQTVKQFLTSHSSIEKVLFVCFEADNALLMEKELKNS